MSVEISASMVKELRERTGSGMMECKKALVEANGDMELAIENMRKAGLAKADKKSGRIAAEGIIGVKVSDDGKAVAMVDVNCETDFVAKADDFINFVNNIANALLKSDITTNEELLTLKLADGQTLDEARRNLIAKLGENITVRRFQKFQTDNGGTACYLHGNKIGVIVELAAGNPELGKDVAMLLDLEPGMRTTSFVPDWQLRRDQSERHQSEVTEVLLAHFSLPNRPAGRITSTMAMITNTTMFDASG